MTVSEDSIFVEEQSNLKAINIKTAPYPGLLLTCNNQLLLSC